MYVCMCFDLASRVHWPAAWPEVHGGSCHTSVGRTVLKSIPSHTTRVTRTLSPLAQLVYTADVVTLMSAEPSVTALCTGVSQGQCTLLQSHARSAERDQ